MAPDTEEAPKWLATLLGCSQLVGGGSRVSTTIPAGSTLSALAAESSVIGIYFTASWCAPCKQFSPQLAAYCNTMNDPLQNAAEGAPGATGPQKGNRRKAISIVVVSCDQKEEQFVSYLKTMPANWLAVPFEDLETRRRLMGKFPVRGIPCLILLEGSTGQQLTEHGVESVQSDPNGLQFPYAQFSPPWYRSKWVMLLLRQLPMILVFLFYTFYMKPRSSNAVVITQSTHDPLLTTQSPHPWLQPVEAPSVHEEL